MDPVDSATELKHTSPDKTGWASRLSQKLKRSSGGNTEYSIGSQDDLAQQSTPSTISENRDSTSTTITNPREFLPGYNAGGKIDSATTKATHTQMTSPTGQALRDDIIGLGMKVKARRRSDNSDKQGGSGKSMSSLNPFTRNHHPDSSSSMNRRDGRTERGSYEVDKEEEEAAPRQTNINVKRNNLNLTGPTSHTDAIPEHTRSSIVKRKELPIARGATASTDHPYDNGIGIAHGNPETDLPIAAEFTNHRNGLDARSSLDAAREILNQQGVRTQTEPRTHDTIPIEKMTKDVEHLGLSSPEVLSPASFASANENYFDTRSEMQSSPHPSAEEIVERAKYDSTDTMHHKTIAPAVTHEIIQKRVHEVTEKRITRDIHHHHHVHRILPVHSVEILPAKHYRIVDGIQVEMKPEEVPQSRIDAWESAIIPKIEG